MLRKPFIIINKILILYVIHVIEKNSIDGLKNMMDVSEFLKPYMTKK